MRMVRWAMGVSRLEHRRIEEILEEEKVEAIATVLRWRRPEKEDVKLNTTEQLHK